MTEDDSRLSQLFDPQKLPLLYHTASNMYPRQLAGVADRKLRHAVVPALPVDFDRRYGRSVPAETTATPVPVAENVTTLRERLSAETRDWYRERAAEATRGVVTFVGQTVQVEGPDGVGWYGEGVFEPPALWALKFHGFEFLRWVVLGYDDPGECPDAVERFRDWIEQWERASEVRIGTPGYLRRAWTPHSVSLRLLNWSRFYAWSDVEKTDPSFAATLRGLIHKNARFLANHVEYDLGGNHLIENGVGLAVAGRLLEEPRYWERGVSVLEEAATQFLADGGHFELSPMYHVLTLTRYLTVADLFRGLDHPTPTAIRRVCESGTRFLRSIRGPDGRIPLLNDAVYGEALSASECLEYADAVGVDGDSGRTDGLDPSGYYWFGSGENRLLVDGGRVGPAHLPAHSHNDQFAVLAWVEGRRVLADTGTLEYVPTAARQYARSVEAHNTVQYGDVEPIPFSGSYLLGRRFEPSVRSGEIGGVTFFDGAYRRERARETVYRHRRRVFGTDEWWLVWDRVTADEARPVRSRLHFDPDVSVAFETDAERPGDSLVVRDTGTGRDRPLAHVVPLDADGVVRSSSRCFPEFGRQVSRDEVTLRSRGTDVSFGFLLSPRPYGAVEVERDGESVAGLTLDGTRHRLPDTRSGG